MLFWSKKFVWKQDKALKFTLCILYFTVQSILGLQMTDYEKQNVTWGGGSEKCQKSVTYYLNGPLLQCFLIIMNEKLGHDKI